MVYEAGSATSVVIGRQQETAVVTPYLCEERYAAGEYPTLGTAGRVAGPDEGQSEDRTNRYRAGVGCFHRCPQIWDSPDVVDVALEEPDPKAPVQTGEPLETDGGSCSTIKPTSRQ